MASTIRALRRRILTPNLSETKVSTRGFYDKNAEARGVLETIGTSFLAGLGSAAEARHVGDIDRDLQTLPTRYRGFAYEGAGMGFALLDAMLPGRPSRTAQFLAGTGDAHVYMVYVGIGWAMARVPRFLWGRASAAATDPLLRWLVLDGYGFHQAYFHTERFVFGQQEVRGFPWPKGGPSSYASRVIDQGIGRAMWFVGGADAKLVADMIDKFDESRREDLYSGAGLAATYAGGCTDAELEEFADRAGEHLPFVAQASAFAAEARIRAGLMVPHTEKATTVFCRTSAREAGRITQDAIPSEQATGPVPAYEVWRRAVADRFRVTGGTPR